jgi:hypothetical protein
MKPINNFLISAGILLFLSSFTSCQKEDLNILPQETQTGANTFGCNINGQLYLGGYFPKTAASPLSAEYLSKSKKIIITAYGKINNKAAGSMYFEINNPVMKISQNLSIAYYSPGASSNCFQYLAINEAGIYLSKFDTINKIVSGNFNFLGRCSDALFHISGNDSIQITQGRFDIKLDIYNN